ncbi:MAG: hypothetical protein N2512_03080 [Armatimonadetes bacterium]|nr:hypothetical protein [Armatimonadota bacterium]
MARQEVAKSKHRSEGCLRYEPLLQRLVLGILPKRKRSFVAAHLSKCKACREYLRQAKRLPAVLARIPAPVPSADLADQIKGACLVASLASPREVPILAWGRGAYAGAAAAALLLFTALSYLPIAARTAHHQLSAVMYREPVVVVPASWEVGTNPGRLVQPAGRSVLPHSRAVVRPGIARAAAAPVQRRWYTPPGRPTAPPLQVSGRILQTAPQRQETRRGDTPARAPRGPVGSGLAAQETSPPPPSIAETSVDGINGRVAHGVAAGVLAGALIEHYLADAIARRGTDLAAASLGASPEAADVPASRVSPDAVPAAM